MLKRMAALLLICLLLPFSACAELAFPADTAGQIQLREYIDRVNANLAAQGQAEVNALFECYTGFATLGIVQQTDATTPEDVELTFLLHDTCLNSLQLRVSSPEKFAAIAASCIQAACPDLMTLQDALTDPARYAGKVTAAPDNSFEDVIETLNGPAVRIYYAYYPNQYNNGVNWLQMTLVFPLGGIAASSVTATQTPPPSGHSYYDDNADTGYEGYDYDGGTHLEIFTTATPEPDSAAGNALD